MVRVVQDGGEIDILVQKRKDKGAGMRFFKRLLKGQWVMPLKIVTDKLASYSAAKKEFVPSVEHSTVQYETMDVNYHISPLGNKKDKCEGSNLKGKRSDF